MTSIFQATAAAAPAEDAQPQDPTAGDLVLTLRHGSADNIEGVDLDSFATLGQTVTAIRDATGTDCLICAIDVDGTRVDDTSNAWTAVELAKVREVKLHAVSFAGLMYDCIEDARQMFDAARAQLIDVAWGLRLEDDKVWMDLAGATDLLSQLHPFLTTATELLRERPVAARAIADFYIQLASTLNEVHQAQSGGDTLALADAIENKLVPGLDRFNEAADVVMKDFEN